MCSNELEIKLSLIHQLEAQRDELIDQIDALKDSVKAEMAERKADKITAGNFHACWPKFWKTVFDTTAFKRDHSELYDKYTIQRPGSSFRVYSD